MKKYMLVVVLMISTVYSYGIRPAFDVNAGWQYMHMEGHGYNFAVIGLGTTAPYSRYIGLCADVAAFLLGEQQTSFAVAGNVGFIEMIPTQFVSPYFKQQVILSSTVSGGHSITELGLGGGVGVEFMSNFYISPFIEGNFGWAYSNVFGSSSNTIGLSVGGGVRFSWQK